MTSTETITITERHTSYSYNAVSFIAFGVFFILIGIAIGKYVL